MTQKPSTPDSPPQMRWIHSPVAQGLGFGLLVAILLILTDRLSMYFGLQASARVVDDISGGVIAGLLVYWYSISRMRGMKERLTTIALMNHHIRNALQVIAYSAHLPPDPEKIKLMLDALKRIEWALQEVLPGQVMDYEGNWTEPSDVRRSNDRIA